MAETFYRIIAPVAGLYDNPTDKNGLLRQALFGEGFICTGEEASGFLYGKRAEDSYCGWIKKTALGAWQMPNAQVAVGGAHIYGQPEVKSLPKMHLPFQAKLGLANPAEAGEFAELTSGDFIPRAQIIALEPAESDYVNIAKSFLHTPYLWGGDSQFGIDCSGLIYRALRGVGKDCPADSTPQQAALGCELPKGTKPLRGDLLFWQGHVGIVYDDQKLLHANAHHMRVVIEPLATALARIREKYGLELTRHKRL